MSTNPDWRDAGGYDYTATLDAGGWAWEFLRRNPDYRADYDLWRQAHAAGTPDALKFEQEAGPRWGLRFPGRSRPRRQPGDRALAGRAGSGGLVPDARPL